MIKTSTPLVGLALAMIASPLMFWGWSMFIKKPYVLPIIYNSPCVNTIIIDNQIIGIGYFDPLKKYGLSAGHVLSMCHQGKCLFGSNPIESIQIVSGFDIGVFTGNISYCKDNDLFIDINQPHSTLYTMSNKKRKKIPVFMTGTYIDIVVENGQSGSPLRSGGVVRGIVSRKYASGAMIEYIP